MMLHCDRCGKPVLSMTSEQADRYRERPSAYSYICSDCRGDIALQDAEDGDG